MLVWTSLFAFRVVLTRSFKSVRTEYHPIATAAMLPRSSGGVVASDLVVYGTQNLRVVDVSVVPLHVASHVSSISHA